MIQTDTNHIAALKKIMPPDLAETPLKSIPAKAKGFADLSPEAQVVFNRWLTTVRENYELHGFSTLNLAPFVSRKILVAKGGIDKQIFSVNHLSDNSMTQYGLAFDRTVPFAAYVRDHMNEVVFPFKRSDVALSFRAESTKVGRFNGFIQADVDIAGRKLGPSNDAECISTIVGTLEKLQIPKFYVHINHLEVPKQLIKEAGIKNEYQALRIIDELDKTPPEEIVAKLMEMEPGLSKESVANLVFLCTFRGPIDEFIKIQKFSDATMEHLQQLQKVIRCIDTAGIDTASKFKFTPGVTRGLDYYTGIVFETFLQDHPTSGSIASGGRYDKLVDVLAEEETGIQAVGGAIGLSRLFDILLNAGKIPLHVKIAAKVVVCMRNQELMVPAFAIANQLRKEGVKTEMYTGDSKSIKGQLDYVNKTKAPFALMVMDTKCFVVKDMAQSTQTEDITSMDHTVARIVQMIKQKG